MAQKEIEFRIKPDGTCTIETFGMNGSQECSKIVEKAVVGIGGTMTEDKKKPEYWDDGRKVYIQH